MTLYITLLVSFITLSGSLFITLSAKNLLHYRGGCLLHYRLNLLHYQELLHYRLIFITLSGSITLSGVYYIIGCNKCPEKFKLYQIQNDQLVAIIDFNMRNRPIRKIVIDS